MADEMGYQQTLWIGTAGTTAGTQVTQVTDVDYDVKPERGATTVRGLGVLIPIKTENVTQLAATISWKMVHDPADAVLILMIAAAKTGAALAIKVKSGTAVVLFDGDCTLDKKFNSPLAGESSYDFSAVPTKSAARTPTLG